MRTFKNSVAVVPIINDVRVLLNYPVRRLDAARIVEIEKSLYDIDLLSQISVH